MIFMKGMKITQKSWAVWVAINTILWHIVKPVLSKLHKKFLQIFSKTLWGGFLNYIGSKVKLLPFLQANMESILQKHSKPLADCVFCDIFAGTGAVGRSFKPKVKQIISNDKEYYSFVLNQNYIANNTEVKDRDSKLRIIKRFI